MPSLIDKSDAKQLLKSFWAWFRETGNVFIAVCLGSLAVAVFTYQIVVDQFWPSRNVLRRATTDYVYTFHSGTEGGYYRKLANHVQSRMSGQDAPFRVTALEGGSSSNIRNVIKNRMAFGIAQEDSLETAETDGYVQVIAPLYNERVHVIYSKKRFQEICSLLESRPQLTDVLPHRPRISTRPDLATIELFRRSTVRVKSSASTKLTLGEHILAASGLTPRDFAYLGIDDTFDELDVRSIVEDDDAGGDVHVAIVVAGGDFPAFRKLLRKWKDDVEDRIGLMSIDASVVATLNATHGRNYQFSNFSGLELGVGAFESVNTLATRAMLFCSNDVPLSHVREVARTIDRFERGDDGSKNANRLLDEYAHLDRVIDHFPSMLWERVETWSFSIFYLVVVIGIGFSILNRASSVLNERNYSKRIMSVYSAHLSASPELKEDEHGVLVPASTRDNDQLIESAKRGITELLPLARDIREDYRKGAITLSHQRYLLENVYEMKGLCQQQLARCLSRRISEGDVTTPAELQRLYTAGYLTPDDFHEMVRFLRTSQSAETTAPDPIEKSFFAIVKEICSRDAASKDISSRDTPTSFNVIYAPANKWFLRLITGGERIALVTRLAVKTATDAADGLEVDTPPPSLGSSRVYVPDLSRFWDLAPLIRKSLREIKQAQQGA